MKRTLTALLLALLLPAAAQAQIPPPVTIEAIDGSWAIGQVFTLAGHEPITANTTCITCMASPYKWTLLRRDECEGVETLGFFHALGCAQQPISGAHRWHVTGHPSTNCWTLEYCYP